MNLFNLKDVTLHSGGKSDWIIDCEALTDDDLAALARIGSRLIERIGIVVGVPKGGLRFGVAMRKYTQLAAPTLIVDDVLTTGSSMEHVREQVGGEGTKGLVIFARGPCPDWITPIWRTDAR